MKRSSRISLRSAALAFALSAVAGCNDEPTAPAGDVDPVQSAESMDDVVVSMETNEALQSFNASGSRIVQALGGAGGVVSARVDAPLLSRGLQRLTLHALAVTDRGPSAHLAGVIPEEYWGITFVLENGEYVASERTGAPATGVRFILYAINPVTKEPIEDVEVGWVDLVDESDGVANSLRIIVVSDDVTHVDYAVSCGFVVGGIEVSGNGFITDGETRANLDLSLVFSQSDGISFDFLVDVPSKNLELDLAMTGLTPEGDQDDTFTATYRVKRGSNEILFELTADQGELSGTVTFNGALAAVISGTLEDPVVTDAEGNELGPEGRQALHDLLYGVGRAIEHLSGLLGPAFEICFLAN